MVGHPLFTAPSPIDGKTKAHGIIPGLVLFSIAFALYAPSFFNQWSYDDFAVVVQNPDIQSLDNFIENSKRSRPIRELTYMADYFLFDLDPAGYHIQSIFWHALNSLLLFVLARHFSLGYWAAWTAALLFLVHPVNVEVAAVIAHRKDSLVLAFSLLSLLFFMKLGQASNKHVLWLILSALAFVMACFSKQNAYVLPAVFLTYWIAVHRDWKPNRQHVVLLGVCLAAGATLLLVWYFYGGGRAQFLHECRMDLAGMNYTAPCDEFIYYRLVLKSWVFIFLRLILPLNLALEYQFAVPENWYDPWVIASICFIAAYVAGGYYAFRKNKTVFFFLVWIGLFWLPTSSLWPGFTNRFIADRYLHTPSVGFFILLAMALDRMIAPRSASVTVTVVVSIVLAVFTWHQIGVWQSPCRLWAHAVEVSPESGTALNNLGKCHLEEGEYQQAESLFMKSLISNPYNPSPYYNLGLLFEKTQKPQLAISYYTKFLAFEDRRHRQLRSDLRLKLEEQYDLVLPSAR